MELELDECTILGSLCLLANPFEPPSCSSCDDELHPFVICPLIGGDGDVSIWRLDCGGEELFGERL